MSFQQTFGACLVPCVPSIMRRLNLTWKLNSQVITSILYMFFLHQIWPKQCEISNFNQNNEPLCTLFPAKNCPTTCELFSVCVKTLSVQPTLHVRSKHSFCSWPFNPPTRWLTGIPLSDNVVYKISRPNHSIKLQEIHDMCNMNSFTSLVQKC